jgi:hypothetical protein
MYDTFRGVRKINTVKQSPNTPFSFKFVASILVPVAGCSSSPRPLCYAVGMEQARVELEYCGASSVLDYI